VEDDPDLRQHAEAQIRALGYRVSVAENADEALALLEQGPSVDLLFTDVIMPGSMHGAELARTARAAYPDLKVLFTSGYTKNVTLHKGRLDENVELLSKPYRREDLARRLREQLDA
jgi:CheY-like chemotaxis protein